MKKYSNTQIAFIQDRAHERIIEIFDSFAIDYIERNDYIQCACHVHGGDNPRGMYWAMSTNHWRCKTRHCDQEPITGPSTSIFGLVRGIMSHRTEEQWSFAQAVSYVAQVLNLDTNVNESVLDDIEVRKAINQYKQRQRDRAKADDRLTLARVLPQLTADTEYYPGRGISAETIAKYHISLCMDPAKQFGERAFFPILDTSGRYVVGWSGRSIWEECPDCRVYHNQERRCPADDKRRFYPKWKHSEGFRSEHQLYNLCHAKSHITRSHTAIICEGPGNCWALDAAGIQNSVAIFGLTISKQQRQLLQQAGALTLIVAFDNDKAGQDAKARLAKNLEHYFRLFFVEPNSDDDVGSMSAEAIQEQFGDLIGRFSRELK